MYVRNPYLRAKCSEVLAIFLPNQVDRQDPTRPLNIDFNHLETLFQGHPVALEFMVPNLLRLYVDIEFTGSHNQVRGEEDLKIANSLGFRGFL